MGELRLSSKERIRLELLGRVKRKEITVVRAAELAGVSVRQMRRLWKRFGKKGDAGVVHRLRGRKSNNRMTDRVRSAVLKLYREKYHDFGPTFACEKLAGDGHEVSPTTLTRLLKGAGLWEPRRRRGKHRSRRQRRSCIGQLVQMDGSEHDWFEGRGDRCVLMVMIDDATNKTLARFYRRENLDAAWDVFGRWADAYGLPRALYVDRAGIYRAEREPTGEELLSGTKPVTQFGRAMVELGVELILAHSPQAKGRVERRNGLLQDRLVKEMRLRKIGSIEAANAYLDSDYLASLNTDYTVDPADPADGHRPIPADVRLDEILCEQQQRTVGQDWCVRWDNGYLQIDKKHESLDLAGKRVLVKQKRDGTLLLEYQSSALTWAHVAERPEATKPQPKPPIKNNKKWTPAASHPWRGPAVPPRPAGW
jgi:hypothetical protein